MEGSKIVFKGPGGGLLGGRVVAISSTEDRPISVTVLVGGSVWLIGINNIVEVSGESSSRFRPRVLEANSCRSAGSSGVGVHAQEPDFSNSTLGGGPKHRGENDAMAEATKRGGLCEKGRGESCPRRRGATATRQGCRRGVRKASAGCKVS